jgi:hypothetical protein
MSPAGVQIHTSRTNRENERWLTPRWVHGTALTFARTDTDAFHRYVWDMATAVLFLRGRITFHKPDLSAPVGNSGAASVLAAYGEEDARILANSGLPGKFIRLKEDA